MDQMTDHDAALNELAKWAGETRINDANLEALLERVRAAFPPPLRLQEFDTCPYRVVHKLPECACAVTCPLPASFEAKKYVEGYRAGYVDAIDEAAKRLDQRVSYCDEGPRFDEAIHCHAAVANMKEDLPSDLKANVFHHWDAVRERHPLRTHHGSCAHVLVVRASGNCATCGQRLDVTETSPYAEQSTEWRAGYDAAEAVYHAKQRELRSQARASRRGSVEALPARAWRLGTKTERTLWVKSTVDGKETEDVIGFVDPEWGDTVVSLLNQAQRMCLDNATRNHGSVEATSRFGPCSCRHNGSCPLHDYCPCGAEADSYNAFGVGTGPLCTACSDKRTAEAATDHEFPAAKPKGSTGGGPRPDTAATRAGTGESAGSYSPRPAEARSYTRETWPWYGTCAECPHDPGALYVNQRPWECSNRERGDHRLGSGILSELHGSHPDPKSCACGLCSACTGAPPVSIYASESVLLDAFVAAWDDPSGTNVTRLNEIRDVAKALRAIPTRTDKALWFTVETMVEHLRYRATFYRAFDPRHDVLAEPGKVRAEECESLIEWLEKHHRTDNLGNRDAG